MKNKKFTLNVIAEVAIFSAVAFVLDVLQGGIWRGIFANGGSIGLAMIPILIISYRRGFLPGLICGIIVSFLQLLGGWYAIADTWYNVLFQIALDYIVTYPLVAFAGIFAKSFQNAQTKGKQNIAIILGTTVGGLLKLLSHFLAGAIFWKSSGLGINNAYLYSLVYNGGYMIPNIIIAIVILIVINLKQPSILNPNIKLERSINESGEIHE